MYCTFLLHLRISFSENKEVVLEEPKLRITHQAIQTDKKDFPIQTLEKKKCPNEEVSKFMSDEKKSKRFYGIDDYDRETVYEHLGEAKSHLKMLKKKFTSGEVRKLNVHSQYLYTLIMLRKGYEYGEGADLFGFGFDLSQCIFKTWIIFMFKKFGSAEWRKRLLVRTEDLPKKPPKAFRNKLLRKVRLVIDTTSIKVND